MKKIIAVSVLASSMLLASGWRIPEQSASSLALSGAYVANAHGADSAYFNPANMAFNKNSNQFEADLNYIHLSSIHYIDNANAAYDGKSESEDFLVPTLFFSSDSYGKWRFGASFTAPGGLARRWEEPYQAAYAKKFELKILEFNPVVAYQVSSTFAVGAGVRFIYSEGRVINDASSASRDMEGDAFEFGYNLALTYKPLEDLQIAATYRSNVDIKEEGNAEVYLSGTKVYDGGASVTVPLPAVLSLALSYEFASQTVVEFEYDRTFWSKYDTLDFEYKSNLPAILVPAFDDPKERNWEDSDAFRVGITQKTPKYDVMVGFAYDQNPVPDGKVSFELPDSDAILISFGTTIRLDEKQSISLAYLYDRKLDRDDVNADSGVNGEFSNSNAQIVSVGYRIDF